MLFRYYGRSNIFQRLLFMNRIQQISSQQNLSPSRTRRSRVGYLAFKEERKREDSSNVQYTHDQHSTHTVKYNLYIFHIAILTLLPLNLTFQHVWDTCTTCTCAPYITILLVLLQYRYTCTGAPYTCTRYHYNFKIGVPNFAFFLPFFLSSSTFFDEPCSFTSLVFLVFRRLASFWPSSVVGALFTPMHVGYALRWRFLFFPIPPDSTKSCTPTPSFIWRNESITDQ